ncbi:MAG: hypothetical protein GX046_00835 [Tissierellia bacterium]|nr:hypothetical protein [Tissierellia bacterium]
MVKIIAGGKGSGKTKRMIRMANEVAVDPHGSLFFIDGGNRNIFELNRNIRFINTDEFKINTPDLLYGFLCGILAGDYDTEKVYIDGIDYVGNLDSQALEEFIQKLEKLSKDNSVEFFLCFTTDEEQLTPANKERLI